MKGIILAGGTGSRLYPLTMVSSKQLLPVYNKPLIYYPLSVLMMAGIRDILIISTKDDLPRFKKLFGNGALFGISISYELQPHPEGLAQAFLIGEQFIGSDSSCLILGDNVFYGSGLIEKLHRAICRAERGKATIFAYYVKNPNDYGVVEIDENNNAVHIKEKPKIAKSNYAVTGLYFYPSGVSNLAKKIKKSKRGEYEISSLNNMYIMCQKMHVSILGRGNAWLDTGTPESLLDASNYIKTIEERQGIMACCPEEIAFLNGWITKEDLIKIALPMKNIEYGKYLLDIASEKGLHYKLKEN